MALKSYTLTYKRFAMLLGLFAKSCNLQIDSPEFVQLLQFIGWAISNKYQDLTKLPEYSALDTDLSKIEADLKKAAKAFG